ncbi:hypothetical protein LUZ63_023453 [Rhynchospora breviuscula]|uniref:tRNA-dihydrouridine(47) synthase [NAD(P)(+)] n=1 Tax=Rhynchospora breviuscula TaxID=2022672 RepID=A0A9P9Z2W0_9POAL|nr:hypothetical protein LUZ63_023453 [Rhynchospora breviuscula]
MRKGIDADHLTFLDAGRIAEDAGAAAVALHARTASEFYSGTADWSAISALKQTVTSIPVLGNGDIWSADDAVRMMAETGCDGVVVGRGCLGRPWLFGDLARALGEEGAAPAEPVDATLGFVAAAFRRHAELLVEFFEDEGRGCRDIRKHVAWYFKGYPPRDSAAAPAHPSARRCPTDGSSPASSEQPRPPPSPMPNSTTVVADASVAVGVARGRPLGYDDDAAARYHREHHRSQRDDFARDRARVLHSAALRRLAAKTQVLSPASPADFARNRLTHSLEVAQVGRELATALMLSPDVVDTACLNHDLGHPPFGHNGERALNDWAEDIGGFEGNAQTLRIVTRLEPKVIGADGTSFGLNLTRASLDATCKYPWTADQPLPDPGGRLKFGVYPDDEPVFRWMREGAPGRVRCIEAEVMDLSDDIAYSVHDFEDAIVNGYLDPARLADPQEHEALLSAIQSWVGFGFGRDELADALFRILRLPEWLPAFDGTRASLARLKNLTSDLIGRFARAATTATRERYPQATLTRYSAHVVVPAVVEAEMAVLKGIIGATVVSIDGRKELYKEQRRVLKRLATALWEHPDALDPLHAADFAAAQTDAARRRVVVDQVASLTDQHAIAWHGRLVGDVDAASLGVWAPGARPPVRGGDR